MACFGADTVTTFNTAHEKSKRFRFEGSKFGLLSETGELMRSYVCYWINTEL